VQPLSEQESAAQVRLLIDSALTIQSQGQSLNSDLMTELLMAAGGSAESFQSEDPAGLTASIRQAIEEYLLALSTLTPSMAILFAGVLTLIDRQDEFDGEARSDDSAVGSISVTELTFTPRQLAFLFESALTLYSADGLDACDRLLRLVLEQAPDHGAAHAASGMLAERQHDHEGVLRWYRSAYRLMPGNIRIPLVLVNKLINLRRLDEAQIFLDEIKATLCDQAEFWAVKASVAHEQHRLHEALECYARATALEPDSIEYRHMLASIHLRLGDFDSANKILERVLGRTVGEGDTEVDTQGAIGTFVQATIPIPFVTLRVRALALSGQVEAALQMAQKLYDLIPEAFEAGICLAEQQIAHSEFNAATEILEAIKPTDQHQAIKKLLKQAELASAQYDPHKAIEYAEKATNLDSTDLDAQTALIGAQLMAADVAAAQATMRKVDQILKRDGREAARY
jgi:thioredoxin-like negative regulator of GroEL